MWAFGLVVIVAAMSGMLHGEFPHLDEVLLGGVMGTLLDIKAVLKKEE